MFLLVLVLILLSSTAAEDISFEEELRYLSYDDPGYCTDCHCLKWGVGNNGVERYLQDEDCCSVVEQAACDDDFYYEAGDVCDRYEWGCVARETICRPRYNASTMRTADDPPRADKDLPCMKPTPIQVWPFILGCVGMLNVLSYHWGCQQPRWQDDPCRCGEKFDNSPRIQNQEAMVMLQLRATVALSFMQAVCGIIMVHHAFQWDWGIAHTVLGLWSLQGSYMTLRRLHDRRAGLPVGNQLPGKRPLVPMPPGQRGPWLPGRPAAIQHPGLLRRALYTAFFPLTMLMATLEWIIQAFEAGSLFVLMGVFTMTPSFLVVNLIAMWFCDYPAQQEACDGIDGGGNTLGAAVPSQMVRMIQLSTHPQVLFLLPPRNSSIHSHTHSRTHPPTYSCVHTHAHF